MPFAKCFRTTVPFLQFALSLALFGTLLLAPAVSAIDPLADPPPRDGSRLTAANTEPFVHALHPSMRREVLHQWGILQRAHVPLRQPAWDRLLALARELDPAHQSKWQAFRRYPIRGSRGSMANIVYDSSRLGWHSIQLRALLRPEPDGGPPMRLARALQLAGYRHGLVAAKRRADVLPATELAVRLVRPYTDDARLQRDARLLRDRMLADARHFREADEQLQRAGRGDHVPQPLRVRGLAATAALWYLQCEDAFPYRLRRMIGVEHMDGNARGLLDCRDVPEGFPVVGERSRRRGSPPDMTFAPPRARTSDRG